MESPIFRAHRHLDIGLMLYLILFIIITLSTIDICTCEKVLDGANNAFLERIMKDYGNNVTITYEQLESYLEGKDDNHNKFRSGGCILTSVSNASQLRNCKDIGCTSLKEAFEFHNLQPSEPINITTLNQMAAHLLYLLRYNCNRSGELHEKHKTHSSHAPSAASVWGYGFLMVTGINLFSLIGVMVLPFMKLAAYKQILIFMVALAVGALAGSGLLFLIPEAFGLVSEEDDNLNYVYKASMVMGGIYLFYLTEKIMRILTNWKERRNMKSKDRGNLHDGSQGVAEIICSVKKNTPATEDQVYKEATTLSSTVSSCTHQELLEKSSDESCDNQCDIKDVSVEPYEDSSNGDAYARRHMIKPLAWMIIFGDGLHNFIDGLSIGAAFTQSTLAGISVSVAVMCEELPHELGDFAILLNCGMTVKKALVYNFLSACMCYLGLIIGILLGENTSSHDWIFALAGGMFLYISLTDMMPEMNSASEAEGTQNRKKIFILQNLGLATGFGVMFILAVYGRNITFE